MQATILATKSPSVRRVLPARSRRRSRRLRTRARARATAGSRTRSAALATPCASVLTPRSHRLSAPSGVRTRVTGVRDRHPGRLDDQGVKHGRKESNPLRRCWRPHGRHVLVRKSVASSRIRAPCSLGPEANDERPVHEPKKRARGGTMGSTTYSSGGIRTTHPSVQSRRSCR